MSELQGSPFSGGGTSNPEFKQHDNSNDNEESNNVTSTNEENNMNNMPNPFDPHGGLNNSNQAPQGNAAPPAFGGNTPAPGAGVPSFGGDNQNPPQGNVAPPSFGGNAPAPGAGVPNFGGNQTPPQGNAAPPSFGGNPTPPQGNAAPPSFGGNAPGAGVPNFGGNQTPPQGNAAPPAFGGNQAPPAFGGNQAPPAFGGNQAPATGFTPSPMPPPPGANNGGGFNNNSGGFNNNSGNNFGNGQMRYHIIDMFWLINESFKQTGNVQQGEAAIAVIGYNASFNNLRIGLYDAGNAINNNSIVIQDAQKTVSVNLHSESAAELLQKKRSGQPVQIIERIIKSNSNWQPAQCTFIWNNDGLFIQAQDNNNSRNYGFTGYQETCIERTLEFLLNGQAWSLSLQSIMAK
jgi:hypothetical protein